MHVLRGSTTPPPGLSSKFLHKVEAYIFNDTTKKIKFVYIHVIRPRAIMYRSKLSYNKMINSVVIKNVHPLYEIEAGLDLVLFDLETKVQLVSTR